MREDRRQWSDDDIALLKKMYDDKEPMEVIGSRFGMGKNGAIGAIHRFYPERKHRRKSADHADALDPRIMKWFAQGLIYADIAKAAGIGETKVHYQLAGLRKADPMGMARAAEERAANKRRAKQEGRDKFWQKKTHNPFAKNDVTDLDRAINFLRKYTGVWKDKKSGKVVYGSTRKTPEEIIALAKRKGLVLDGESA